MSLSGIISRFLAPLVILPLGLNAQISVTPVSDTTYNFNKGGMYYVLPRTQLQIGIQLERTDKAPGILSEFSKEYVGIENPVTEASTHYEVLSVSLVPVREPDPDQVYFLEGRWHFPFIKKNMPSLCFTTEGFLQWAKLRGRQKEAPACSGQAPSLRKEKIAGSSTQGTGPYYINNELFVPEQVIEFSKDSIAPPPPPKIINRIAGGVNLATIAKETLESLKTIRENRQKLVSGYQEVGYDPQTLKIMLQELDDMESGTLELFSGSTRTTETRQILTYLPEKSGPNSIILGYLDPLRGIVAGPGENAEPVTLQLTADTPIADAPFHKNSEKRKQKGMVYRIPATVSCSIIVGSRLLWSAPVVINQMGSVSRLPVSVREVDFNPFTGGVIQVR